jgi:two-component system nitrogen regulation response regulator GlnG
MMQDAAAVLVVEDDASVREVLDMVFAQEPGIYYAIAAGGANGMAKLEDGPPDVLLTDILMPRVSGIDLIQFARRRYPGIPILAFSARPISESKDLQQIVGGEMIYFMSKPFDLTALVELVRRLASDQSWRTPAG